MAQVHNKKKRMPLILPDPLASEWIREGLTPARINEIAHYQIPSDQMEAVTIRKEFRTALDPMEREEYTQLPPLAGVG
jgi:hypothetical protein